LFIMLAMAPATTAAAKAEAPSRPARQSGAPGRAGAAAKLFRFDRSLGARFVAGADEAGGARSQPAGGRRCAHRLREPEHAQPRALSELDDSKVRSPEEREELYPCVLRPPREWPSRSGASAASTPGAFT